jgi:hypothetical protein
MGGGMPDHHTLAVREKVVELWRDTDLSATQIGQQLGMTRSQVIGIASRAGVKRSETAAGVQKANARAALKGRIQELRRQGRSLSQIAKTTCVAFATVQCWCVGVPTPFKEETPLKAKKIKVPGLEGPAGRKRRPPKAEQPGRIEHPDQLELPLPVEPPKSRRLFLDEVRRGGCRDVEIAEDVVGGMWCAEAAVRGSYCAFHAKLHYRPRLKKEKKGGPTNYFLGRGAHGATDVRPYGGELGRDRDVPGRGHVAREREDQNELVAA